MQTFDVTPTAFVAALGGVLRGTEASVACPVCQPERRPDQHALSVSVSGGRLLLCCHKSGCSFHDILAAVGFSDREVSRPDPTELREAERRRRAEAEKRERQARTIWDESAPIAGTVADGYLRSRGITGALPDTLRFNAACWHPTAKRFPAMISRVEGAEGFAIHRTYLASDGSGKADVMPAKAMLGPCSGGAVRLSGGGGRLVVCEGIETGLSLLSGLLDEPASVWAALSTSGMKGLHLPAQACRLVLASDGDIPARNAAYRLAARAQSEGWTVSRLACPDGMDFNDILQEREARDGVA